MTKLIVFLSEEDYLISSASLAFKLEIKLVHYALGCLEQYSEFSSKRFQEKLKEIEEEFSPCLTSETERSGVECGRSFRTIGFKRNLKLKFYYFVCILFRSFSSFSKGVLIFSRQAVKQLKFWSCLFVLINLDCVIAFFISDFGTPHGRPLCLNEVSSSCILKLKTNNFVNVPWVLSFYHKYISTLRQQYFTYSSNNFSNIS